MASEHATPTADHSKTADSATRTPQNRGATSAVLQRLEQAPQTLRPADVLQLQRSIGNRATGLLLQAKLKLGPAGDRYEQEADRVAKQVVSASRQPEVQREEGEEGAVQTSRYASSMADYQRSATPVAAGISRVQRGFFARPQMPKVQRDEMEDELQASPNHGLEGGDVDADVARSIQSAKGGGQPLHDGVRSSMEKGFGADFGGVRVHTGGQADALNRSLNAKAFTTGKDIFFGKGQYSPGSTGGQELIAHELTHTVQQGAAGVQRHSGENIQAAQAEAIQRDGHTANCGCADCAPIQRTPDEVQRHHEMEDIQAKPAMTIQRQDHSAGCDCAGCKPVQRQIESNPVTNTAFSSYTQRQPDAHNTGCGCGTCAGKRVFAPASQRPLQRSPSLIGGEQSRSQQALQRVPQHAALVASAVASQGVTSDTIQRHASWEHKMIGDMDPDELAILGTGRDLQDGTTQSIEITGKSGAKQNISKQNVLHLLQQEVNRLAVFQSNPPKPWSGTGSSKTEEEKKLREASFERANKTNEQLVRENSRFSWGSDSASATAASQKTVDDNQGGKEDSQWQVDLLEIKSDYAGKAKHKTIVVTYGEMNTLADFYGSLEELKNTNPDSLYAIVQGVRQESLKKL